MAILIDQNTRIILQGMTGRQGRYHTLKMLQYGVQVVGGISPGKGGQDVHGVPVYNTVVEAQRQTELNASMIIVPPAGVLDASLETIEDRIPLLVIITEFVPYHDALIIRKMALEHQLRVVGPNTIGIISPGQCKVGIMPGFIYSKGNIGIISRSGTLTHEIASNLTYKGYGQSTCICIGGDMVRSTDFVDVLQLFREDSQTETIIMIGEIGGTGEEKAAQYIQETHYPKKVIAFIAGASAPANTKMGHAGAIVAGGFGSVESKRNQLAAAGVTVVNTMDEIFHNLK